MYRTQRIMKRTQRRMNRIQRTMNRPQRTMNRTHDILQRRVTSDFLWRQGEKPKRRHAESTKWVTICV